MAFMRVGQALVGEVLVGEQRVAAGGRHFLRVQHRAHGRAGREHLVGVPGSAEILLVGGAFDDRQDFRIVRHALHERMQVDIPPAAGKRQLLGRRQVLVADRDHQIVEQSGADFRQDLVRRRPATGRHREPRPRASRRSFGRPDGDIECCVARS